METSSLNIAVALFFGFLSFLSPCILPLLPGYLFFIAGSDISKGTAPGRKEVTINSLFFVMGFGLLFIFLGAIAGSIGQWLVIYRPLLLKLAGVIILLFGLHISEIFTLHFLLKQAKWQAPRLSGLWYSGGSFHNLLRHLVLLAMSRQALC